MPEKPRLRLRNDQARRIALRAQGFGRRRPGGRVTMREIGTMIDRVGLIQIDSVNVLARAHLLPAFSRLGPYDPALLERASGRAPRRLVEYWAHEASLIPPETHRLLRWRMERADLDAWKTVRAAASQPRLLEAILAEVRQEGAQTAAEVSRKLDPDYLPGEKQWGWNWPPVKSALEYLFFAGRLSAAGRSAQFERLYDLPERVLPEEVRAAPTPEPEEAIAGLIEIAARAHGVGTAACLRDYFRLPARESAAAIKALVGTGRLIPVEVEGFSAPAYLHCEATRPRRIEARALLAPFDPLVFERARLERLFNFHYRIEIYTPKARRRFGYYVLPFLLNEEFVARVDLKADRAGSALLVKSAWAEESAPPESAAELAAELELMAGWLGLDRVVAEPNGDLAPGLMRAL
ncbi:MAG: YcaQ family DNA glycosylase [Thermoleophilia bacterium]|nr:YcaQ family DNA glycosylase [Thermoleophilia bacterium]